MVFHGIVSILYVDNFMCQKCKCYYFPKFTYTYSVSKSQA